PEVVIMDENSHEVSERYYRAGSAVELTCVATQLEEPGDHVTWRYGDVTLTKGISMNTSLNAGSVASTLTLERAEKHHSGNYTCAVGNLASSTISVHILNGKINFSLYACQKVCQQSSPCSSTSWEPSLRSAASLLEMDRDIPDFTRSNRCLSRSQFQECKIALREHLEFVA
ncbi:hypothetical protein L9F63_003020, partial [Diploptera punctata]